LIAANNTSSVAFAKRPLYALETREMHRSSRASGKSYRMTPSGQTICLSMIVKNEAHVIRRCIESVRSIIDHWIIVDTGSTDGTQDAIRASLADLPGTLHQRPWIDFAHNRSEALTLARPHGTYTLIIDADDELVIPPDFTMPALEAPSYRMKILDETCVYERIQLVRNDIVWYYQCVIHEFIDSKEEYWTDTIPLAMRRGIDGARHKDPTTYLRDIKVLEDVLKIEKDPFLVARYTFYLAQSYRDGSIFHKALEYYLKRAELGYWNEEIYISLFSAALLMDRLDEPEERILATYQKAIAVCPHRAEAMASASNYCRRKKRYAEGYALAESAVALQMPDDGLHIQPWIYNYGAREEYAAIGAALGHLRQSISTCLDILNQSNLPPDVRTRITCLSRETLAKMIDPVWGIHRSSFSAEYAPQWDLSQPYDRRAGVGVHA
jgi:tetratricopeptide (TPR) repeat protein